MSCLNDFILVQIPKTPKIIFKKVFLFRACVARSTLLDHLRVLAEHLGPDLAQLRRLQVDVGHLAPNSCLVEALPVRLSQIHVRQVRVNVRGLFLQRHLHQLGARQDAEDPLHLELNWSCVSIAPTLTTLSLQLTSVAASLSKFCESLCKALFQTHWAQLNLRSTLSAMNSRLKGPLTRSDSPDRETRSKYLRETRERSMLSSRRVRTSKTRRRVTVGAKI